MRQPDPSTPAQQGKASSGHRWEMCALARRIDPAEMYRLDGDCAAYVAWLGHRWREFDAERGGRPARQAHSADEHEAFDAWLRVRALELADEVDE